MAWYFHRLSRAFAPIFAIPSSLACSVSALAASLCFITPLQAQQVATPTPDVQLASDVVMGKSTVLTYAQALETIRKAADAGNLYAIRMNAVMWRSPSTNPSHRTSHTAFYLGLRRLETVDSIEPLLANYVDPQEFVEVSDLSDFTYMGNVDPMSDANLCALQSTADRGVSLGFDNAGAFIGMDVPAALKEYARFGVRVDKSGALAGTEPEQVAQAEKIRYFAARLVAGGNISLPDMERKSRDAEQATYAPGKVYVAKVATPAFDRLLADLATGEKLMVRAVLANGSEQLSSWQLLIRDERMPQPINPVDFVAYRYVNCIYGRLHQPN